MFTPAGRDVYELMDPAASAQTNTRGQGDDCWFQGTSRVTVTMTEALDGATYMCVVGDAVDKRNRNYDTIVLSLQRESPIHISISYVLFA